MKHLQRTSAGRIARLGIFGLLAATLLVGTTFLSSTKVEANHPVLVEGNCDSPVPGTTLVAPGTCGDFDGDGRIGTAEDTDGADRIFGTLRAALGPGTGAAAGTGANYNGSILIVKSGRFAESLIIGNAGFIPGEGTANPGNLTIEAAPGVEADIDAVLQGDPAGGNTARQAGAGIVIIYSAPDSVVTLRNLTIRNFLEGVGAALNSRVVIDNCRFENNRDNGVRIQDSVRLTISNTQITASGRRIPVSGPSNPGNGLTVQNAAQARIYDSVFSHNLAAGISNLTGIAGNVVLFKVGTYFNGTDINGTVTIAPNPNQSN
jgi:Right handed beta helix region